MSYKPVGQHTRPKKTTNEVPSKPNKIPKHDSAQKRRKPLKINRPSPRFPRYEMAVNEVQKVVISDLTAPTNFPDCSSSFAEIPCATLQIARPPMAG
jgi:hypothetical protein